MICLLYYIDIFHMDKKIIKKIYIILLGKVMIKIIEMIFMIIDIYSNIEMVSIMDMIEFKILTVCNVKHICKQ